MSNNDFSPDIPLSMWCVLSIWRKILWLSLIFAMLLLRTMNRHMLESLYALSRFLNCSFLVLGVFLVLSLNLLVFFLCRNRGVFFALMNIFLNSKFYCMSFFYIFPRFLCHFCLFCFITFYSFMDVMHSCISLRILKLSFKNSFSDSSIIVMSSGMNLSTHRWFETM